MAIATLLLSTISAGYAPAAAPAVAIVTPAPMANKTNKKTMPTQDDKDQSGIEDQKETEARAPLIDQEVNVADNIFKRPIRDAKVQLKISGNSQIDLGMTAQDKTINKHTGSNTSGTPYLHIGSTKLKFEASVKVAKMVAGWFMRFNVQTNDTGVDRNGIFWKHDDYGQINAGNIKAVDDDFFKFAQRLIGGSNGWDSGLPELFVQPADAYQCEGTNFVGSPCVATKISYATPKLLGFLTLAGSYTPNTAHRGAAGMVGKNPLDPKGTKISNNPAGFNLGYLNNKPNSEGSEGKPVGSNNITLVAHVDKKYGKWTYGAAFTYIHDTSEIWYTHLKEPKEQKKYRLNDVNSWGVSYLIGYDKFTFGLEYMNNGKSRLPVDDQLSNNNDLAIANIKDDKGTITGSINPYAIKDGHKGHAGHVVTATAQYKWTEKLVSATGFQWTCRKLNEERKTTRKTFSQTFNYLFMPGLEGYIEGDMIWLDHKDTGKDTTLAKENIEKAKNTGFVLMIGARVHI